MSHQQTSLDMQVLHATTVSIGGQGVVLSGDAGSGKSSLALQLIALGAQLVADDQTQIALRNDGLWAAKPQGLPQLIEARGVGLISVPMSSPVPVVLFIDMNEIETRRLPEPEKIELLGQDVTKLRKVVSEHFPSSILLYVTHQQEC